MNHTHIIKQVADYYTNKLQQFGTTSKGVDWKSEESQFLRFQQLLKLLEINHSFSVLDYGCGFGSMYAFMREIFTDFHFTGFDISESMIEKAKELFSGRDSLWITQLADNQQYDYVIASGIFNVKMNHTETEWQHYILDTLQHFNQLAIKGFSFNVLTSYSDREYMRPDLHYAHSLELFDYCKKEFSKYVALLHDYPLYEFTILVRK
jgi:SAM-dependent methyltransferase